MTKRKETEDIFNESTQEKLSFKITKGQSRLYQIKRNIVKESIGEWFIKTLFRGIFYFFIEPANFFYFIASLIMIIGGTSISMYPGVLYFMLLAILLAIRLITFFIYEKKRFNVDQTIGMQKFVRTTRATLRGIKLDKADLQLNKIVPGQELCVGDIIKFKKYDIVPCDCILLAASDKKNSEYVCFVDKTISHGQLEREKKQSIALARSFTHLTFKETTARQFVKRITGKVEYFPFDKVRNIFSGSIKLKSDPKVEQLDNKNLLMRGSIIRSRFAYGLVVFAGSESTTLKGQLIERGKRSSIHTTVTVYSIIAISTNLLISLVSIMTLFVRTQNNKIITTLDPNLKNGLRIFTFLVLYCPIVPLSMLVMIEISNVLYARKMERKYRDFTYSKGYEDFIKSQKVKTKKGKIPNSSTDVKRLVTNLEEANSKSRSVDSSNSFKIFNANVLPDLGCADHIFFDKTGTLVTPDYEIITVATTKKMYKSEDNNFLNDGIIKAIKEFEKGRKEEYNSNEDSAIFSEGSRRSVVSNPNYNFSVKKRWNNPLSSRSSRIQNTETEGLLNDKEPYGRSSVYHPNNKPDVRTLPGLGSQGLTDRMNVTIGGGLTERNSNKKKNKTKMKNKSGMKPIGKPKNILAKIYDEYDFFKDTVKDTEVCEMMKMFTICHNSIPSGDGFESSSFEEKAMLMFSKNFNYTFSVQNFKKSGTIGDKVLRKIKIKARNAKAREVNIYIINEQDQRKRFSILVSNPDQKGATLYVRGVDESMRDLIDWGNAEDSHNKVVKHNLLKGLRTYVFAKKYLSQEEAMEYTQEYDRYRRKLLDQRINMRNLALKMEKNLSLVCVVGFKNKYKGEAKPVVKNLKDMGVRVSMLTGDDYLNAKMTSNLVGMVGVTEHVQHFNFHDKEGGMAAIKEVLEKFKKITLGQKKKMGKETLQRIQTSVSMNELKVLNKTVVVFSGEAWNIMRESSYLHSHFLFICQFARSIIGYKLSSKNKEEFVREFIHFNNNHKKIVVCVGDGFNDMGMLKEASVGIQIQSKMVDVIFGDIYVNNLAVIPVMMRREGRTLHSNLKQTIHIFFGQALGIAIIALLYQGYCSFTGAPIINSELLQLNYILVFLNGLMFVMFETKFTPKLNELYPCFYMQRIYTSRNNMTNFLSELIVTSIESIWILFFTLLAFTDQRNSEGEIGNMHMVSIIVSLANQFLTSFKFVVRSKNATVLMFIFTILSSGTMLLLVSLLNGLIFLRPAFDIAGIEIFSHYNAMYVMFSTGLFTCLFSWIMWETYLREKRFPILCDVERKVREGDFPYLVPSPANNPNKNYLEKYNDNESFSSVVSNCFTSNDKIDLTIENILSSTGNSTDIMFKKSTLEFFTTMLEKKYKIFTLKRFLHKTQLQMVGSFAVFLFTMIISVFFDSVIETTLTRVGITFLLLVVSLIVYTRQFRSHAFFGVIAINILVIAVAAFNSYIKGSEYTMLFSVVILLITTNYNTTFKNVRWLVGLHFLVYIIVSFLNVNEAYDGNLWPQNSEMNVKIYAFGSLFLLGILMTILSLVQRYKNESLIKNEFKSGSYMQDKSKITKDLLGLLLPKFVLEKFESYEVADYKIGEDVGEITIMFCDIADFDKVVKEKQDDIVRILDSLFRKFDELCTIHGLQKIETVGKTYMACGGLKYIEDTLPASQKVKNPTLRVLDFAKDMMRAIKDYEGLKLKIGVHYGKCMMGVIGYHKPQFSLIGDAVNTTSRHCTTGMKGHIMISKEAWQFLNESNARTGGYTKQVIPTKMKGKTKKNELIDVYHVFPHRNKLRDRLGKIMAGKNMPEALKKVLSKDRNRGFAPDFTKLAQLIDQVKNNLESLRVLQSKSSEAVPKNKKNKKDKKKKKRDKDDIFDDISDEFEISSTDDEEQILKPNLLLRFKNYDAALVKRYFESMKKANKRYLRSFHFILFFQNVIQTLMYTMNKESITSVSSVNYYVAVVLRSASTVVVLFMIIFNGGFFSTWGKLTYNILYFYISASGILQIYLLEGFSSLYYSHIMSVELIFTFICAIQCGVMDFVQSCTYYVYQLIIYILFYVFTIRNGSSTDWLQLVDYISFFLISGFYSLLNNYIYIKTEIEGFNSESQNQKKVEEMDAFINRLLPRHTVKTLGLEGMENKGDKLENVTLIFADIKGFTAYSSEHTPDEVVDLVYSLFTSFDKECNRLGLYKVYTIGDCYVAMSFIDKDDRKTPEEEAYDVLEFGFKMIEMIAQTREEVNFPMLKMRIGIHTGNVIGGVVGTGIIRFDMYGQDVAIANAMESEGIPDEVKVSYTTKKLLENYAERFNGGNLGYYFVKQEDVEIKKLDRKIENYLVKIDDHIL